MPEHYTKKTVSVARFCPKCGRETTHRVDNGRRGPCLVCLAKQEEIAKNRPPAAKQENLF